jgi:hypothetical protein
MRCDAWMYENCSRESGSKKNAMELVKLVTNFLGECEDPQRTWDLFKEEQNNKTYLSLPSLRMGKLVEDTYSYLSKQYIVYKTYSDGRMEQVSIPLSLDKAKSFRDEMQNFNPTGAKFSIMQEVE